MRRIALRSHGHRSRRVGIVLAAILAVGVSAQVAASEPARGAPPSWAVQDLGSLPTGTLAAASHAYTIGPQGVAGSSGLARDSRRQQATLFTAGGPTALGALSGDIGSAALGTDGGGTFVGYSAGTLSGLRAVEFAGGTVAPLGTLPGDADSVAFALNKHGQAVGYSQPGVDLTVRPAGAQAVLFSGGTVTPLGHLPGDSQSVAYSINDEGVAVGGSSGYSSAATPVMFTAGEVTSLPLLRGDTDGAALAIDDSGEAVGYSAGPTGIHAVRFEHGRVRALQPLKGDVNTVAVALNAEGDAVGSSDADGYHTHAVLFRGDHTVSLDGFLPAGSGWVLRSASAIDDGDRIAGTGIHNGELRAFLLTPPGGHVDLAPTAGAEGAPADSASEVPANPAWPSVLVHYDYMVEPGPAGHTDAPDPAWIAAVAEAFRNHQINLVVDPVHSAIPERSVLTFASPLLRVSATGPDIATIDDLRSRYLPTAPATEHYAVFGYYSGCLSRAGCDMSPGLTQCVWPPSFGQTGWAELREVFQDYCPVARNFIVSLGARLSLGLQTGMLASGGTFMHELGHNLGLHHGGGIDSVNHIDSDETNYKPNYLSVMNYRYQFSGIQSADVIGSSVPDPALTRLDYSGEVLPVGGNTPGRLLIGDLNEPAGLGSGTADVFTYVDGQCDFPPTFAPTDGPVDWDGDGSPTGMHVYADVNSGVDHPCPSRPPGFSLVGANDWADLHTELAAPALPVTSRVVHARAFQPVRHAEAGVLDLLQHDAMPLPRGVDAAQLAQRARSFGTRG